MLQAVQDSIDPRREMPAGRPADCRVILSGNWLRVIALCMLLTLQFSRQAYGSCGDYLAHGPIHSSAFDTEFQLAAVDYSSEQPVESRCRNGNCQSQPPANAPAEERLRVEDRRSDMVGPGSDLVSPDRQQFGHAADQRTSPQAILDVAVPPPRF